MQFPYVTPYVNRIFLAERERWDFIFLRPVLLVLYFFIRIVVFPIKFLIHRKPWGFEARVIDSVLAWGTKWFATYEAAEIFVRHVQIEPKIYAYLLNGSPHHKEQLRIGPRKFNGMYGDFNLESLQEIRKSNFTIGHDELSYEIGDHFRKDVFLENLSAIRASAIERHEEMSKAALEENRKHSKQWIGATNVVIFIVMTITIFGDLKTVVRALNSFDSDSIVLWCMRTLYSDNKEVLNDLEFYLPTVANRSHYNSSVFFSDPSEYLYYHIAFDEYVYDTLVNRPPTLA